MHSPLQQPLEQDPASQLVETRDLVGECLRQQQDLTAVGRFSQWHDEQTGPLLEEHYRSLIPLERPSADEQYAFEVDLDLCSGCKACVTACHSLNGLETEETWRDVGLLIGEGADEAPACSAGDTLIPAQTTVTTACHHCEKPACLEGCPVLAYDKDPDTGIVRHLDDQCIGCQYCILKCPYDVPKYSRSLGIVRKCDMCFSRLSAGEAPACVQACPNEAIRIIKRDRSEILSHTTEGSALVPGAFDSSYTRPATRFLSKEPLRSDLRPADIRNLTPQSSHLPLVSMLILTQAGIGLFWIVTALRILSPEALSPFIQTSALSLGLLLTSAGLVSSVFHLGHPLKAWKFFLGLKTSWLSREIAAFSLFASAAFPATGLQYLGILPTGALTAVSALGALSLFCSIMIYVDTHRPFWSLRLTASKFFLSTLILGLGGLTAVTGISSLVFSPEYSVASVIPFLLLSTAAITVLKLCGEGGFLLFQISRPDWTPNKRSSFVMLKTLKRLTLTRFTLSSIGVLTPLLLLATGAEPSLLGLASAFIFPFLFVGEWAERILFFKAVTAPKMPGELST